MFHHFIFLLLKIYSDTTHQIEASTIYVDDFLGHTLRMVQSLIGDMEIESHFQYKTLN